MSTNHEEKIEENRDLSRLPSMEIEWIYIKIVMQWDRNSRVRGCLDAITNYHRVSSWSKYTREARTKSCMPIGIILVIGFVVSRNIHRCGVRLLTSLVFVRDKTRTIRSPRFQVRNCRLFYFYFRFENRGEIFFNRDIKPPLWSFISLRRAREREREMCYSKNLRFIILKSMKWKLKFSFSHWVNHRECWNRNEIILIHRFLWLIRLGGIETANVCIVS